MSGKRDRFRDPHPGPLPSDGRGRKTRTAGPLLTSEPTRSGGSPLSHPMGEGWGEGCSASVLVGLLWCLALLSVVVIGVLHTARLDLMVVKNYGDVIQAHYLALAGIEKAKALIYHDAKDRRRAARNHTGALYDSPEDFRDVSFGRGQYRIFHQGRRDEGGKVIYGISDEEGRLNVNSASPEELAKLYGMTTDIAASIMDWRDGDNSPTPGGAESEYYASLRPPYLPRNGPFRTIRELLMVQGVTRDLLFGEDANQNGLLDPEEDDGKQTAPPDNHDGIMDAGWSSVLTINSAVKNVNAAGEERVNVQSADESALAAVPGISKDLAKAIVAYRNQNRIEAFADLLEVTAVPQNQNQGQQPGQGGPGARQPGPRGPQGVPTAGTPNRAAGPKLIDESTLMEIGDDVTTASEATISGLVNINTASPETLACLPGLNEQLAQAIVSYRQSAGFFPNIAWLLKVDGISRDIFKQVAPRVTARSETFRIMSEGKVTSSGARKRLEVVVRLGRYNFQTLAYREDL